MNTTKKTPGQIAFEAYHKGWQHLELAWDSSPHKIAWEAAAAAVLADQWRSVDDGLDTSYTLDIFPACPKKPKIENNQGAVSTSGGGTCATDAKTQPILTIHITGDEVSLYALSGQILKISIGGLFPQGLKNT